REAEAAQGRTLARARPDRAPVEGRLDDAVLHAPRTSASVLPRSAATASGVRSSRSAAMVARTMLCGLFEPRHLVSTLAMPASSTSALKLKRRPPFTTFATRLMWTTFSFSSTPWASVMMRRGPPEERSAIDPFSELESALARPLGDGAHAAVVEEAVAVEHD